MIYRNKISGEYKNIPDNYLSIVDLLILEKVQLLDNEGNLNADYISSMIPKGELTLDEIKSNNLNKPYLHIKSGNKYYLKQFAIECTNGQEDTIKVIYCNEKGSIFCREIHQFFEKFWRLDDV